MPAPLQMSPTAPRLARLLALAAALAWQGAAALGLGPIELRSKLNQPLDARIQLIAVQPGDLDGLSVRLAEPEAFASAGLQRPDVLLTLRFQGAGEGADAHIRVRSEARVREPVLDFIVEVIWPHGRTLRGYTLLLETH